MECLYCGFNFDIKNKNKCPACGTHTVIMVKIYNASVRLYNKGLEQALNNDFYNAIISLKKSIVFNKQNIEARNLLGLVYYHVGRLAEAVEQWIVSSNFRTERNDAVSYIDVFQKNIRNFEKLNDSVKMYNYALTFLKQKNDDVAIIRLKKSIDVNPNFVDARNLLTLCYIKRSKKGKALELAEGTLKIDACNPIALNFIREINISISSKKGKKALKKEGSESESVIYSKPKQSFGVKILFAAAGAICAAVTMGVLVMPAYVNLKNEKYDKLEQKYAQLEKDYNDYKNQSETKIGELEGENQQMKGVVDDYNKTVSDSKKIENLSNAQKLFDEGNSVEAAKVIAAIDTTNAQENVLKQYNELKAKVYASASEKLYNEGESYFASQDWENAKNSFSMSITFGENSPDFKYSSYYELGKIALNQNDNESAKKYFNEVKANHPNDSIKGYADNYLKTL